MKRRQLILLCMYIVLSACISNSKKEKRYFDLRQREYGQYKGLSLFIRGYDGDSNPIIYLQDYSVRYNICGYKYFITKVQDTSIIASGTKKLSDTCQISISSADSLLVRDFTVMKVRRLMVDNSGNIFISINSLEAFDIAKLVNYNDSTQKYKSWVLLGGDWYQRP